MAIYEEYRIKCMNCKTREDAMNLIAIMDNDCRISSLQYYDLRHLALEYAYGFGK